MEEYRSNSNKSKAVAQAEVIDDRKIESVVSEQATVQKKSGLSKFTGSIIQESLSSLGMYILEDHIIPGFKKAIDDIFSNGIHYLLYGKSAEPKSGSLTSKISYGGFYQKSYNDHSRPEPVNSLDFDTIVFNNRGDAEAVLSAMDDIIDSYGVVSVGDLYELSNVAIPSYTVNKYGWTNIRSAEVLRCRDGYMIKMPKAAVLK